MPVTAQSLDALLPQEYDNCFNEGQSGTPLISYNRYPSFTLYSSPPAFADGIHTQVQEDVGRLKRHWPADFIQEGGRTYELVGVYGILLTYERMHLVLAQHLQLGR